MTRFREGGGWKGLLGHGVSGEKGALLGHESCGQGRLVTHLEI